MVHVHTANENQPKFKNSALNVSLILANAINKHD